MCAKFSLRQKLIRSFLLLIVVLCLFGFRIVSAAAQSYPDKLITIVVPVPPGGLVDLIARLIGQQLSQAWSQTVVVENKAGGSFQIAASHVAKSSPDGYTLLLSMDAPFIINPNLYQKLSYDPDEDFEPITALVNFQVALVAHPSLPANNVSELIALARKKPGALNYGSFGVGSTANLYMQMLANMAGINLTPVHYKGVAPMITDVVAGHVPMMFITLGQTLPLWNEGKLKVLGVATPARVGLFPEAPTISESGVPGFEAKQWFGLFAPRNTPREIVDKINGEVRRIFSNPAFRDLFLDQYVGQPILSTPEELRNMIKSEREKWGKVIRDANIKID